MSSVKSQIVKYLNEMPLERAYEQPEFRKLLTSDAVSTMPLFSEENGSGD